MIAGPKIPCRKIEVQGAKSGKYFEYPEVQKEGNDFFCSADFNKRILSKVSACVGVGIYSVRLHFDDGSQSPVLGSRTELTAGLELGTDPVTQIGIRAWKENYVQTLVVNQASKKGSVTLESQSNNGDMKEFKLASGERIVGIHGYLDPNGDLRGFGFIVVGK